MENLISSSVIDSGGAEILANAYIEGKWLDWKLFMLTLVICVVVLFLFGLFGSRNSC